MKRLLPTLAACLLLLVLAACEKELKTSDAYVHSIYDMVTLVGCDREKGTAQFELVGRDGSSTMLTGRVAIDSTMRPLQRVVLRYIVDDETTGSIKVYGMTRAITDSLRYSKASISLYARHPVKTRSAWRTGDFINLHMQVEYTGKSRTLMMLIDDATRYQDTVHCYLHHDIHGDTTYHWRECYASFNVGNVWKRTECKTLRLHINEEAIGEQCYDFDR